MIEETIHEVVEECDLGPAILPDRLNAPPRIELATSPLSTCPTSALLIISSIFIGPATWSAPCGSILRHRPIKAVCRHLAVSARLRADGRRIRHRVRAMTGGVGLASVGRDRHGSPFPVTTDLGTRAVVAGRLLDARSAVNQAPSTML